MKEIRRVMILSVKAGAGHIRAAEAVEKAFAQDYPAIRVRHLETLAYTNRAFQRAFTGAYNTLAKDLPSIWGMIYGGLEHGSSDSPFKKFAGLFDRLNARPILDEVAAFDPDHVICTHYLPAEILGAQRRSGKLFSPVSVILTDYDIHAMWIQEGVDRYFVATDEMAHALGARGLGPVDVRVVGIPVMPAFGRRYPSRPQMRRRIGIDPDLSTVLMMAGGTGLSGIDRLVSGLVSGGADLQILALAGANRSLFESLASIASAHPGRILPFGMVANIHELMAGSDVAVTKCGGLTSSECLAMGLPMVIVKPIPGQEERNSDYLLENGAALRANSPAHLEFKLARLLKDEGLRERMRRAARAIARPRAAFDVARIVVEGE